MRGALVCRVCGGGAFSARLSASRMSFFSGGVRFRRRAWSRCREAGWTRAHRPDLGGVFGARSVGLARSALKKDVDR